MTSAVIVNIDSKIKDRAMKKAKNEGIPLSAILKSAIRAYAEGRVEFGIVEIFNDKTRREIDESEADIKKGKNISPAFTTIAQARKYLK